ncbi:GNAT family N-acetyltransferase [Hathewaya massiliensis]|uniref:GNAT family N-acetyltransferase n=1 Tax=Hathewaya massiliensis TaxID=1964382 RepID=UPI0011594A9F|nr:GNAT family N-acetyltransferase [Hathewaya massiliensis]
MNIKLRKAIIDDCVLLFKWVNDEDVRNNSFNTNSIKYEEHLIWFKRKLNSHNTYIFILEEDEKPVGQVRIDIKDLKCLITYSIDKKYRGGGYGTKILYLLEQEIIKSKFKINILIGYVKSDNISSQRCFEKNGYEKYIKKDYVEYRKIFGNKLNIIDG